MEARPLKHSAENRTEHTLATESGDTSRHSPIGLTAGALALLVLFLITQFCREFSNILQPFFIAVFLCYLILPAHRWLVRWKVPPFLSYMVIIAAILIFMYGLGNLFYASLEELVSQAKVYEKKITRLVDGILNLLPEGILAVEERSIKEVVLKYVSVKQFTGAAKAALGPFMSFITGMFIVGVYLLFLVAEAATFNTRLRNAYPDRAGRIHDVIHEINRAISQYIAVKTVVSLFLGIFVGAVLWILGVDLFLLWGVLAFVLNFIPYIGSFISTAIPVLLSFMQFEDPWRSLAVGSLLVTVQVSMAYVVEPRIAGHRLNLSPLVILLALAFWGAIWGIVGMIMAVPLVVVIKSVLEANVRTKPIAMLMANVVAGSPESRKTDHG